MTQVGECLITAAQFVVGPDFGNSHALEMATILQFKHFLGLKKVDQDKNRLLRQYALNQEQLRT